VRAEVKATETVGPVLIHIITEKGRGYVPAETASDKMHGVGKYDILTGKQIKPSTKARRSRAAPAGARQGAAPHACSVRKHLAGAPARRSWAGMVLQGAVAQLCQSDVHGVPAGAGPCPWPAAEDPVTSQTRSKVRDAVRARRADGRLHQLPRSAQRPGRHDQSS